MELHIIKVLWHNIPSFGESNLNGKKTIFKFISLMVKGEMKLKFDCLGGCDGIFLARTED